MSQHIRLPCQALPSYPPSLSFPVPHSDISPSLWMRKKNGKIIPYDLSIRGFTAAAHIHENYHRMEDEEKFKAA